MKIQRQKKPVILVMAFLLVFCALPVTAGTVTDEVGRNVVVPENPRRIITLTPSLTEIVFALGLGDKVVGATTWSNYPEEAKSITRVGAYVSPNLEKIVSLGPDLVIANREGNPPWVVEKLEEAGIPVYVTRPDDPLTLARSMERLGEICGAREKGRQMAAELEKTLRFVRKRLEGVAPVPTLLVIGSRPLVSVGKDTFNGKLLNLLKTDNVAARAKGRWPRLSLEYVIEVQPRVIIVSTMERGGDLEKALDFWRSHPGLKNRPGLLVGGIESDLIDRPGPRLVEGIYQLVRMIHPRIFPDGSVAQ